MLTVDGLDKDTVEVVRNYAYSDTRQVVSRDESQLLLNLQQI